MHVSTVVHISDTKYQQLSMYCIVMMDAKAINLWEGPGAAEKEENWIKHGYGMCWESYR